MCSFEKERESHIRELETWRVGEDKEQRKRSSRKECQENRMLSTDSMKRTQSQGNLMSSRYEDERRRETDDVLC